ncbi:hypothetical protein VTI28DRAFT_9631 [Corynascus sepedonium]
MSPPSFGQRSGCWPISRVADIVSLFALSLQALVLGFFPRSLDLFQILHSRTAVHGDMISTKTRNLSAANSSTESGYELSDMLYNPNFSTFGDGHVSRAEAPIARLEKQSSASLLG